MYVNVHSPEKVLDIQSDWTFVNGMVQLPQEWNFGVPEWYSLHQLHHPHPSQQLQKQFPAYVTSHV